MHPMPTSNIRRRRERSGGLSALVSRGRREDSQGEKEPRRGLLLLQIVSAWDQLYGFGPHFLSTFLGLGRQLVHLGLLELIALWQRKSAHPEHEEQPRCA